MSDFLYSRRLSEWYSDFWRFPAAVPGTAHFGTLGLLCVCMSSVKKLLHLFIAASPLVLLQTLSQHRCGKKWPLLPFLLSLPHNVWRLLAAFPQCRFWIRPRLCGTYQFMAAYIQDSWKIKRDLWISRLSLQNLCIAKLQRTTLSCAAVPYCIPQGEELCRCNSPYIQYKEIAT